MQIPFQSEKLGDSYIEPLYFAKHCELIYSAAKVAVAEYIIIINYYYYLWQNTLLKYKV